MYAYLQYLYRLEATPLRITTDDLVSCTAWKFSDILESNGLLAGRVLTHLRESPE